MTEEKGHTEGKPHGGDSGVPWLKSWRREEKVDPTNKPVISNDEVFALLEFAANNKIKKEQLKERIKLIKTLSQEVHKPVPDPSEITALYASLVATTSPVTGRTLIESRTQGGRRLAAIGITTAVFFFLSVGNSIFDNWIADSWIAEYDDDASGIVPTLFGFKTYVWDYLTPFLYGSLGSCVYLLKAVQDAARDNHYLHNYMEGWGTRVLIGGILAAIVLIFFDPAALSADSLPLSAAAIAFLTGLGVKPVYGALEKTIELLSTQLNLDSIRRAPTYRSLDPEADTKKGADSA